MLRHPQTLIRPTNHGEDRDGATAEPQAAHPDHPASAGRSVRADHSDRTGRRGRRPGARRAAALLATGAAVLVLAAACGGSDDSTASAASAPPAASSAATAPTPSATGPWTGSPSAAAPAGAATRVMVTETEFTITLSQKTFTPGTYTFVTDNTGQATHALEIEGPGVNSAETKDLSPGQSEDLTVTLKPGTYKLYCPVGNHEAQGMKLDITVA